MNGGGHNRRGSVPTSSVAAADRNARVLTTTTTGHGGAVNDASDSASPVHLMELTRDAAAAQLLARVAGDPRLLASLPNSVTFDPSSPNGLHFVERAQPAAPAVAAAPIFGLDRGKRRSRSRRGSTDDSSGTAGVLGQTVAFLAPMPAADSNTELERTSGENRYLPAPQRRQQQQHISSATGGGEGLSSLVRDWVAGSSINVVKREGGADSPTITHSPSQQQSTVQQSSFQSQAAVDAAPATRERRGASASGKRHYLDPAPPSVEDHVLFNDRDVGAAGTHGGDRASVTPAAFQPPPPPPPARGQRRFAHISSVVLGDDAAPFLDALHSHDGSGAGVSPPPPQFSAASSSAPRSGMGAAHQSSLYGVMGGGGSGNDAPAGRSSGLSERLQDEAVWQQQRAEAEARRQKQGGGQRHLAAAAQTAPSYLTHAAGHSTRFVGGSGAALSATAASTHVDEARNRRQQQTQPSSSSPSSLVRQRQAQTQAAVIDQLRHQQPPQFLYSQRQQRSDDGEYAVQSQHQQQTWQSPSSPAPPSQFNYGGSSHGMVNPGGGTQPEYLESGAYDTVSRGDGGRTQPPGRVMMQYATSEENPLLPTAYSSSSPLPSSAADGYGSRGDAAGADAGSGARSGMSRGRRSATESHAAAWKEASAAAALAATAAASSYHIPPIPPRPLASQSFEGVTPDAPQSFADSTVRPQRVTSSPGIGPGIDGGALMRQQAQFQHQLLQQTNQLQEQLRLLQLQVAQQSQAQP